MLRVSSLVCQVAEAQPRLLKRTLIDYFHVLWMKRSFLHLVFCVMLCQGFKRVAYRLSRSMRVCGTCELASPLKKRPLSNL